MWTGKRFVPFTDETLWRGNGHGVYDDKLGHRVISFPYSDKAYDLKETIANRLNAEVPEGDASPQFDLAEKIYQEVNNA
jgi:hypothetical protein